MQIEGIGMLGRLGREGRAHCVRYMWHIYRMGRIGRMGCTDRGDKIGPCLGVGGGRGYLSCLPCPVYGTTDQNTEHKMWNP